MRGALVLLTNPCSRVGLVLTVLGMGFPWPWNRERPPPPVYVMMLDMSQEEFTLGVAVQRRGKYGQKYFQSAAGHYEGILRGHQEGRFPESPCKPAFFLNWGNAAFLGNQLPEAILAYRRGLRLDPGDQRLSDNLEYARAQVHYSFGDTGKPEALPSWLRRLPPYPILLAAFLCYGVALWQWTGWFMHGRRTNCMRGSFFLLCGLLLAGVLWHQHDCASFEQRYPLVVVVEDKAPFLKGNGPSYARHPDLPVLARGMEARLLHERGDWLQIQFSTGEIGWIPKSTALVD
ncbi:MAG: tetratricopeptide repeat protein [Gemmataceae bacterium]|nr:tetratricopeptide repeat protein [Gemmataceae bacterium]